MKSFEKLCTDVQSWDVRLYIVQVEYSLREKAVLMLFSDDVSVSKEQKQCFRIEGQNRFQLG